MARFYKFFSCVVCILAALPMTAEATDLTDGYYYIQSALNTSKYIGVTTDGAINCSEVDVSSSDIPYEAIWQVETTSEGTQSIKSIVYGTYIQETTGSQYELGSTAHGFNIVLYSSTSYYNIWNDTNNRYGFNLYGGSNSTQLGAWNDAGDTGNQWIFHSTTLTSEQLTDASSLGSQSDLSGVYAIKSGAVESVITESSSALTYIPYDESAYSTDYDALWVLKRTGFGKYTIQNVQTGDFVQGQSTNNAQYTTGTSPHSFTILQNTSISSATYYNIYTDATKAESFNRQPTDTYGTSTSGKVVSWNSVGSSSADNGEWTLLSVSMTDAQILSVRTEYLGASTPAAGKYYKIYNQKRGQYLTVTGIYNDCDLKSLALLTDDYEPYTQYWQLTADGDKFKLTNVYTSKQLAEPLSEWASQSFLVSDSGDSYYITQNSSLDNLPYYNIRSNTNYSWMYAHADANSNVVSWFAGDGEVDGSEWLFYEVSLTDDEITAAQADYDAHANPLENASTYDEALRAIFSDYAYTVLRTDVSDDAFNTAYNALPNTLQKAVDKIKGTTDWGSYEKKFRIANYEPYSDPDKWASLTGNNVGFSRIEQSTGIYVNKGDIFYVCSSQGSATDATLVAEIVGVNSSTGTQTTLSQGLNVIYAAQSGNVFIGYHVNTHDNYNNDEGKLLSDYPDVTIHIEGGTLVGYFDARAASEKDGRRGMTNDDWTAMQSAGLFSCTPLCLRTEKLVFSMNADSVKHQTPTNIVELLEIWNHIETFEDNLAGLNDTYWPGLTERWNNIYGCHTMGNNGSYMYATTYGTYYEDYTLDTVMDYEEMSKSTGSGALWGPAHENGHNHQHLINIVGDTEVSNNLFSNAVVWDRGYSTTRGHTLASSFSSSFMDSCYVRRNANDGIWDRTRMYWQLYLYFEVAGNHPNFYPELFTALRSDPMTANATDDNKKAVTYGKDNYLHFALKCCEVSGYNLTEFFEAWGFFIPIENYRINDYTIYYVTTTEEEIAEVKAEMAKYKDGAENIMFIEDRIKYTQAEYNGAEDGKLRIDFEDGTAIGKCGDVGSFTDYEADANTKASGYTYSVDSDGNVTVSGDGAVGYKIYDADGNLVALYNTNSFTLSSTILSGSYTIYAAQADGTLVEIPNSKSTYYTLTAYYGTSDGKTLNITSKVPETRTGNTVFVLTDTKAPTTIRETAQVVYAPTGSTATATSFTLTDKKDFYTPCDFTATTLTYSRENTAGYNSVCLPFATASSDFGTNAIIYSTGSLTTEDGTTYIYITPQDEAVAGTPVLVYCPDDVTSWNITKGNASIVQDPVENVGTAATLIGSYTNKTIGANYYKLNSTGTTFGITTDAGKVFAFRNYLRLNDSSNTSRIAVRIDDGATGISAVSADAQTDGTWYDLQGRRILCPAKGIYIHNGRKVIVR